MNQYPAGFELDHGLSLAFDSGHLTPTPRDDLGEGLGLVPAEAGVGILFKKTFDLTDLDGTNGFRIDAPGFTFGGRSVSSAGDVNGDGFGDLILGGLNAPDDAGGASVVFGKAAGFEASLAVLSLDGSNGFALIGAAGDGLGGAVSSAGDINGDGYDDLMVASSGAHDIAGVTYVVFGKAGGFDAAIELDHLKAAEGFRIDGAARNDASGFAIASAGDVNGDGFDDIAIGALWAPSSGDEVGITYVIYGKAGGFGASIDLATLKPAQGFEILGAERLGQAGAAVSSAGDINADGFDDMIIGADQVSNGGAAYVVFGKASGFPAKLDLGSLDGSDGFAVAPVGFDGNLGASVSSAGDINGDGFDDIIVSAPNASGDQPYSGVSYVVFGKAGSFGPTLDLDSLDGHNGFAISGETTFLGYPVSSAGDVNGDGFDDLMISACIQSSPQYTYSTVYVVYGKASGFHAAFDLSTLNGKNGFAVEDLKTSYSGAGTSSADVNADGLSDVVIGAVDAAYVIFGEAPTTAVNRIGTDASQSLVGGDLKDVLSGMAGDDALWGHGGKDKLTGGTGNDTLIGGAGKDVLIGSAGADVFAYRDLSDSTAKAGDTIKVLGATDIIDVSALDADSGAAGDQAFHLVAAFSHVAGELTLSYDAGTKTTLVQGDVDGDGIADLAIKVAGDHHDFANFVL